MGEQLELAQLGEPSAGAWLVVQNARTQVERAVAAKRALQLVKIPEADRPVPRFFLDLPWSVDNDEVIESILERMIVADDLYAATGEADVRKADKLVATHITVNDVRAMKSDVEDARWGAFLMLDVDTPTERHVPVSVGASEVCVAIWRAYCEGLIPVKGMFILLGNPTPGRNQPIGFRAFPPAPEVR